MQKNYTFRAIAATITLSFTSVAITSSANAAPPQKDSAAEEELSPYGDDIKSLTQPGTNVSCCDRSDCRSVDFYVNSDHHYVARIRPFDPRTGQGFPGGDGKFHEVPEKAVIPEDKRPLLPFALACWRAPNVYYPTTEFMCFTPPAVVMNSPDNHILADQNRKREAGHRT
jgi:hypothetical protein